MDSVNKYKDNYKIQKDILDDLASRFIINVPEERSDHIRICFQMELAHWFYLDFYCVDKAMRCNITSFAKQLFEHIPFLSTQADKVNDILNQFKQYKKNVPTYGAILMNSDLDKVLLVQSYFAKSSWGFPKGKVNEDEDPLHCAIREVYEETGYDISDLIRPDVFIEGQSRPEDHQTTRLYIVQNVPTDTVFVPRTRMEIKSCEWFSLEHLPTHKNDTVCKIHLGINANSFFMIMPYVKRLKRFLLDGSTTQIVDVMVDNQLQKSKKFSNGVNSNGNGSTDVTKKRQRHKSLGDLDGVKPLSGVAIGFQQQGKLPTNPVQNVGSSVISSNGKRKVKPNSKRQLFGGDGLLSGGNDYAATGHYFDDNANTTPTNYGKLSNFKTHRQSTQHRPKNPMQKRAMVPIDDFLNRDPNIDQWNHFSFDRSKLFVNFNLLD
ncbi:m7GpppN-mRNA hydrolase [Bradysia coprophila]|uniref:m7GpppN-mRNA hydrolase n=1 Tax=Bradysia coprophila TaxID=38358 RepID=UPI00187D80B0|nr:m7GpppN-mRNA hydrolase [Bradysia coprophila]